MKFLLLSFLLLGSFRLCGQKNSDVPAFGSVTKEELLKNECDFDKNAEAVIIFDVEDVRCIQYPQSVITEINRRVRIKILKNKGLDQANINIPYIRSDDEESIGDIKAQTYNLDQSGNIVITKIDRKSIFDKAINKMLSQKVFSFPEVKIGSILEYSYKISATLSAELRTWNFQHSIPVQLSRYSIDFPTDIEVNSQAHCILPVETQSKDNDYRTIKTFTMKDIPAFRDEPFITCEEDYEQRVDSKIVAYTVSGTRHSLGRSWWTVANSLMSDEDFGLQLSVKIPNTQNLDSSLKTMQDPYQKMMAIYRYVRNNILWNGNISIWALHGVKNTWKDKKGNSGDINLLLINLLKSAGLTAYPVLVSTHENGVIDQTNPTRRQFDKVIAIVYIHDQPFVLDASDEFISPKLIPLDVMYSVGFLIKDSINIQWDWLSIWDARQKYFNQIVIQGNINEQGVMDGEATLYSYDYSRAARMPVLKKGKSKFIEKYLTANNVAIHEDSVSFVNEENDTLPLIQKFNFNQTLSSSGDYKYFVTNLFTGLEKNPFVAETRFSDVFFGANQKFIILESFFLPNGYVFDELPKNIRMMLPDTSIVFTRIIQSQSDRLSLRIELEFKKPIFNADEYGNFREFYKRLYGMLNEQIVIKKHA
jgi:hypothetical protein